MAYRRACTVGLATGAVLLLAGCGGNEDTISPAGRPERSITNLFWVDVRRLVRSASASIVLLLFLGWCAAHRADAARRRRRARRDAVVIGLGVALPVVLLVALFVWSDLFVTQVDRRAGEGLDRDDDPT